MNKARITPIVFSKEINKHVTNFIDVHEEKIFPVHFLSSKLTNRVFFADVSTSEFFSEKERNDPYLKKFSFLGEILLSLLKKETEIKSKISSLQGAYGLTVQQLHEYNKLRKAFNSIQIGNIINYSLFEPVIKDAHPYISATTTFDDPWYKELCRKTPVFLKLNLLHQLDWCNKHYKKIVKE